MEAQPLHLICVDTFVSTVGATTLILGKANLRGGANAGTIKIGVLGRLTNLAANDEFLNRGTITIQMFQGRLGTLTNYGRFINSTTLAKIHNSGVIHNWKTFDNTGTITNSGEFNNHCIGVLNQNGTFTGNASVENRNSKTCL